jgi:hypothetical protein
MESTVGNGERSGQDDTGQNAQYIGGHNMRISSREVALKVPSHRYLALLLDRDKAWELLGDFDALMKSSDERIQSEDASSEAVEAARLMHDFARDHYHLLLVGQFKLREIGRGIWAAVDSKNEIVLFNLTRAFIEHTAALAYQINALERAVNEFPKKPNLKGLRETVLRHHRGVKKLYYNRRAAVHVHDMIRALSKDYELARREYDELCEFVHPNHGSNKLVSSGELGAGQIRSHAKELGPELLKRTRSSSAVQCWLSTSSTRPRPII